MQREISDDVKIGASVTLFQSIGKAPVIDKNASDFDNANLKVKKTRKLTEHGIYNTNIARYVLGTLDLVFQGMIEKIKTIEFPADTTYKDKENSEFDLTLDNDHYTNLKSLHLCFPIRFRKLSNADQIIPGTLNNFFAQWIKEIDIMKYGANKSLIPTTSLKEIYRFLMKCLNIYQNPLKMIKNNLL